MMLLKQVLLILLLTQTVSGVYAYSTPAKTIEKQAGITPDSRLWALDRLLEKIELKVTRDPVDRVQKRMEFAEERMAEAEVMLGKRYIKSIGPSIKALDAQEELLNDARDDTKQIKKYKELTKATQAISRHRVKMEEQKEKLLETLSTDPIAKDRIERAFDKSIMASDIVEKNLNKTMKKHQDKVDSFFDDVSSEVGVDAKEAYYDLMETGTIDTKVLSKAVDYANGEVASRGISLEPLEGKTVEINIYKDGKKTQTATLVVMNNTIYGGNVGETIELNINVEDVPTYLEKFMEEDYSYLKAELIRKGGKDIISIL